MIADLEARIILLTDDLFYARASVARLTVDLEQANRQLAHRDAEIAMLRATSDKSDDKPAERPTYETLERENAALRKIADDAIMLIEHANPDAWNNGNTHPDGFGPDEGAVMASRFYSSLLDTRAAIDAVSKEEQP